MHTAHSARVSVQSMETMSGVSVPHFQRTVRTTGHDHITGHLRGPYTARMADQSAETLARRR